jgi:hypothetical protein
LLTQIVLPNAAESSRPAFCPEETDMDPIAELIGRVDAGRIRADLYHLCDSPLPFRKVNCTLPGHKKSTLDETDDFLIERLRRLGYSPWREPAKAQAFGFDATKPRARAYAMPKPDAPWFTLHNIYAQKRGREHPDDVIVVVAHKDSQSWFDSPGAYDNAVGTSTILEFARLVAEQAPRRTIRFLWCNEEHRPWTSVVAAEGAKSRGERLIAVFNVDSIGGKSQAEIDARRKPNVTLYTTPEGRRLAERVSKANEEYHLGLDQRLHQRTRPGDDDGSFVKAGFPAAIANLGSYPYADPNYHDAGDTADKVDMPNVHLAAKAILAAILITDRDGPA